jgi:hypothetical protein
MIRVLATSVFAGTSLALAILNPPLARGEIAFSDYDTSGVHSDGWRRWSRKADSDVLHPAATAREWSH